MYNIRANWTVGKMPRMQDIGPFDSYPVDEVKQLQQQFPTVSFTIGRMILPDTFVACFQSTLGITANVQ